MATDSKIQSLSPALTVQIGRTKITALICTSSWVSLMTQSLYDQLRVDSPPLKQFTSEKEIEGMKFQKVVLFDALLCECPVELMVSVVEKCDMDLILGCDFLSKIESNFSINKTSTFKWMHNKVVKISEFVTPEKSRSELDTDQPTLFPRHAFIQRVEDEETKKSSQKHETNTRTSFTRLADVQRNENEKTKQSSQKKDANTPLAYTGLAFVQREEDEKNKKSSLKHKANTKTSFSGLAVVEQPAQSNEKPKKSIQRNSSSGFQLKYYPPKDTTKSKPLKLQPTEAKCKKTPCSTIQDGWATVYVSTARLINLWEIGPLLGYYGIWWCDQCECNTIKGLPVEKETMIGLNCRAVAEALKLAWQHDITRLRIVIDQNEGLDLLQSYARNNILKKPTQTKCQLLEVYEMYKEVCMLIRKMDQVKFEYFEDNNKSPENLRNLREDVHKFIAHKDGLRDDRVHGFFDHVFNL